MDSQAVVFTRAPEAIGHRILDAATPFISRIFRDSAWDALMWLRRQPTTTPIITPTGDSGLFSTGAILHLVGEATNSMVTREALLAYIGQAGISVVVTHGPSGIRWLWVKVRDLFRGRHVAPEVANSEFAMPLFVNNGQIGRISIALQNNGAGAGVPAGGFTQNINTRGAREGNSDDDSEDDRMVSVMSHQRGDNWIHRYHRRRGPRRS